MWLVYSVVFPIKVKTLKGQKGKNKLTLKVLFRCIMYVTDLIKLSSHEVKKVCHKGPWAGVQIPGPCLPPPLHMIMGLYG